MAHFGSVVGIALNAFTVSGKKKECSMASARSKSFCASGVHEVLKCTRPSFSGSPVRGSLSAHTDVTRPRDTMAEIRQLRTWLMTSSLRACLQRSWPVRPGATMLAMLFRTCAAYSARDDDRRTKSVGAAEVKGCSQAVEAVRPSPANVMRDRDGRR